MGTNRNKNTGTDRSEDFKAGRGWTRKHKKRSGKHNMVKNGEWVSANKHTADEYMIECNGYVYCEGFILQSGCVQL